MPAKSGKTAGELDFMDVRYPIQVKQKDKTGRPELVTPLGSLFIEGYKGSLDWFTPDELLPILDGFSTGQVHIFNVSEGLLKNSDFRQLLNQGKITSHEGSLSTVLARGQELGLITLGTAEEELAGRCVQMAKRSVAVPRDIWVQLSRSANLIDERDLSPPKPLSEDAKYREFRNFLATSEGPPPMSRSNLFRGSPPTASCRTNAS